MEYAWTNYKALHIYSLQLRKFQPIYDMLLQWDTCFSQETNQVILRGTQVTSEESMDMYL